MSDLSPDALTSPPAPLAVPGGYAGLAQAASGLVEALAKHEREAGDNSAADVLLAVAALFHFGGDVLAAFRPQ